MSKIILSGQDFDIYTGDGLHPEARTGAISPEALNRAGAQGVIIGHSEVGDSVDVARKKLQTIAEKNALVKSTLLIGETWQEFELNSVDKVAEVVAGYLRQILQGLAGDFVRNLVIGYEPKWGSRGSGRDDAPPPAKELINACAQKIKDQIEKDFGKKTASQVPIIYGGRSTPERTNEILSCACVSGLILGSACNSVEKTLAIVQAMEKSAPKKAKILHLNFKAYELADKYEDYIKALKKLDNTFIIYLSPPYTDIFQLNQLLETGL